MFQWGKFTEPQLSAIVNFYSHSKLQEFVNFLFSINEHN